MGENGRNRLFLDWSRCSVLGIGDGALQAFVQGKFGKFHIVAKVENFAIYVSMALHFDIQALARIRSDFPDKFGIPRQSGILKGLKSQIVFEPEFRDVTAIRGLEKFSHLWLVWIFSKNIRNKFSPTVRPPRLGGNTRLGVFATRSSFRPNPIALSAVKIERIDNTEEGPVITVSGADLMDGTPIIDIKPYLPYADSIPDATGGFTDNVVRNPLNVEISPSDLMLFPEEKREALIQILSEDPRPAYQKNADRIYGMYFASHEIKFKVADGTLCVVSVC